MSASLVIAILFSGLVTGGLARLAVQGPDPMPLWLTIAIGLSGSIVGAAIARSLFHGNTYVVSITRCLAVGLVLGYRRFVQHRPLWGPEALRFPEKGVGVDRMRQRLQALGLDPDQPASGPARPKGAAAGRPRGVAQRRRAGRRGGRREARGHRTTNVGGDPSCAGTFARSSTTTRPRRPTTHDAALQYVLKISGYSKPSQANEVAFQRAVDAVTKASVRLLDELVTTAPPRDREREIQRVPELAASPRAADRGLAASAATAALRRRPEDRAPGRAPGEVRRVRTSRIRAAPSACCARPSSPPASRR